jgi:hypothetical protein
VDWTQYLKIHFEFDGVLVMYIVTVSWCFCGYRPTGEASTIKKS